MPAFPELLNTDGNNTETSAIYAGGKWKLPATVDDGDDVALGATDDAAATAFDTTAFSVVALLKAIGVRLSKATNGLLKAEDEAHVSGDYGVQVLAVRKDTAAASSGTTGDYEPLSTDSAGRLRTVAKRDPTDALSLVHMAAEAASQVVKASAGTLHSIVGYVASGESGWIQVHDATSAPANGAVPELAYYVGAASAHQAVNIPLPGHVCATGITLVWSTTGPTKTTGASKLMVAAYYE
jgi:hypothetical protein